nr:DNA repair protein complementing XP-A cells homolog [Onthophagus taurus]
MEKSDDLTEEELTEQQKQRIKKNREKALLLKKSRLTTHPYAKQEVVSIDKTTISIGAVKYKDTGGGFLLEEHPEKEPEPVKLVEDNPVIIEPDRPTCEKCQKIFAKSWLFETFDLKVCDECKDPEEHKLITKSEAMSSYLLKECDFTKRGTPLKFISKKNPHNSRWGEMKLYLQVQVEKRALEIWESEEKLQEEIEKREEKKVMAKTKKYQKQMKELRMNVRSSLYDKTTSASHTHEFGEETYNEEDDNYTHKCVSCGYEETFEKM